MRSDRFPKGFSGMTTDRMGISDSNNGEGVMDPFKPEDTEIMPEEFVVISPSGVIVPSVSATGRSRSAGRVRFVGRSPVQELELRGTNTKKMPRALDIALGGTTTRTKVTRNGISLVPKLQNPEGVVKRLTWWHQDSVVCQPDSVGRTVQVAYDPLDCDFLNVFDESGNFIEVLPLKEKAKWFDPKSTAKAIAETKRIAARIHGQLQNLHVEDSEAALDAAEFNKSQLEHVVQTFPIEGHCKALATPSGDEVAMGVAHASAKHQKGEHEASEAEIAQRVEERGKDAAELILGNCTGDEDRGNSSPSTDGGDAIDFIL